MTRSAEEIFHQVRGVPLSERAGQLNGACGDDATLRARVEALLQADAEVGDFLRTSSESAPNLDHAAAATIDAPSRESPGTRIGPYKLMEMLGEGGFGMVWLAERREPFVQRVALKIIKAGMDTKAVIARFEQERQALAVMDHPSVAKVLDAGMTAAGRPYFVMEHVAGEPITDYCDKHRLTIRQRLELFIPVCEAVQHAHHKGIIHRDIKPSNILVGVRDDQPVPKVIDFGVAKAVSHTLTDKTIFTETGQLIGTPEYMSPEQAEMRGGDIDTRSDVYSLGAVLYELLTGEVPFESKILRGAGPEGIRKVIREQDPPKPSTRLTSMEADAVTVIAQQRRVERAELATQLRRELDWIPLKALRKDRTERYSSPADLARDIRNYLEGKPLEAGPESAAYRFKKLARRNKGLFAAVTSVAAALLIGVLGFAWQAHRIRIERDAAVAERAKAEAINGFVTEFLRSADPNQGGTQAMTIADAMMLALQTLDRGELKDQPGAVAGLLRTIATILNGNGKSVEAEAPAVRALEIERELHPGDHPDVAASLFALAEVRETLGQAKDAESLAEQSLLMRRRLFVGDHADVANSLSQLGRICDFQGRFEEARTMHVQALEIRRRLFNGDHPDVAESLHAVALALDNAGRTPEAEPLYLQALQMRQRLYKGDHPAVAEALNDFAWVYVPTKRFAEAEALWVQSLEMNRRLFQGDHIEVVSGLLNVGYARRELGRLEEAEPPLIEALEMSRRLFPGDNPRVVTCLCSLAYLRHQMGRMAEARSEFDEALAMSRRLAPTGSMLQSFALWTSGSARLDTDGAAAALPELEAAVSMAEKILPPGHPELEKYRETLNKCRQALDAASATTSPPEP